MLRFYVKNDLEAPGKLVKAVAEHVRSSQRLTAVKPASVWILIHVYSCGYGNVTNARSDQKITYKDLYTHVYIKMCV